MLNCPSGLSGLAQSSPGATFSLKPGQELSSASYLYLAFVELSISWSDGNRSQSQSLIVLWKVKQVKQPTAHSAQHILMYDRRSGHLRSRIGMITDALAHSDIVHDLMWVARDLYAPSQGGMETRGIDL